MSQTQTDTGALDSFDELTYGDTIRYVGPEDVDGHFTTPQAWKQPYTFRCVSYYGTLSCYTKFNGPKNLAPEHPCNNPAYWTVVDDE